MKAEEVKLGGYQVLTLLLLAVNLVIVAMSHTLSVFYKYTPKFRCEESIQEGEEVDVRNYTYDCPKSGCPGRYAFEPAAEHSVATEWQLVCGREHLLQTASYVYFAGLMLGGLVAGTVADRIGRLPVLAICLYAQGAMAVALNVVQEYELFLIFRTLQGFFIQGLESCTFILCMELFPTKFRTLVALTVLSMRALGLVILSGLSYAFPDWRILQLVVSVPTAVTVLYIWMIPESPRWLLAKGKSTEAELLLERIANYNGLRCWRRRTRGDDAKTTTAQQQRGDELREKPQKPLRKTRLAADAKSAGDVEKSLEESKELLNDSSAPRSNAEETAGEQSSLPSDLNIEEIARASLMVVADEKSPPTNGRSENENEPAYLLVTKEALVNDESSDGRRKRMGFFESRFIGSSCLMLMCLWFSSSTAFHAFVVSPQQRPSGPRHVPLTIAAGMEVGTFLFAYLIVTSRCGRRWPLCILQVVVGAALIALGVLMLGGLHLPVERIARIRTTIVTVGRVANIGSFFILRLLVIEFFPTISRGTGVGLCVGAEMLGGLLKPLIFKLQILQSELPWFSIGIVCICIAMLPLLFPETSHTVLPDSAAEAKCLGRKGKQSMQDPEVLRDKLFSEDWVDAGNGIIVNFTENKSPE